jgi:Gluconolactonase
MNIFVRTRLWKALILITALYFASCDSNKEIIGKDAKVEKLADGFSFTEGPASDRQGNVYFTDQLNNRILKWSVDNKLSVFMENAGRSNGLYFDNSGNLLACADMENELWSIDKEGKHTVLFSDFEGKKLNGPNDLWIHPNGKIYFTDPLYVRDYWNRSAEMQQQGEYIYSFDPKSGAMVRLTADIKKPNGIIGTPNGKRLYVADIGGGKTYSFDINPDGSLSNQQLAAPMGSDGITMDERGNIYLTGKGVTIFNPQGEKIAHIPVDAPWTANVTFGGKDRKTLFITASEGFYSIPMNVKGGR